MATAQQVADLLGRGDDSELVALADQALPIITAMVNAYTRGRGFTSGQPADDLDAVITTATTRWVVNPDQNKREAIGGDYDVTPAVFEGFTLAELFVLNRYRKRAA